MNLLDLQAHALEVAGRYRCYSFIGANCQHFAADLATSLGASRVCPDDETVALAATDARDLLKYVVFQCPAFDMQTPTGNAAEREREREEQDKIRVLGWGIQTEILCSTNFHNAARYGTISKSKDTALPVGVVGACVAATAAGAANAPALSWLPALNTVAASASAVGLCGCAALMGVAGGAGYLPFGQVQGGSKCQDLCAKESAKGDSWIPHDAPH